MSLKQYNRVYPQSDLLDGDARAVIEADFKEITTNKQTCSFMQLLKDVSQWIKHRLKRL